MSRVSSNVKRLGLLFDKLSEANSPEVDSEKLCQLAATALMIELCRADNDIDEVETTAVLSIAQSTFNLSSQEADDLLLEAQKSNQQATSLYEFTDIINNSLDKAAKYQLIKNIWRVSYADKFIDRHYDNLIH